MSWIQARFMVELIPRVEISSWLFLKLPGRIGAQIYGLYFLSRPSIIMDGFFAPN
jgi:hypothetical protein